MNIEHHKWFSPALGHDMELKIYGHFGQPIVIFPAQAGRYYDYENFGMVEALSSYLEAGRVKLFCLDSVDWQSWTNKGAPPQDRARRHNDYDAYVMQEAVSFVRKNTGLQTMWTSGCSMGALHSTNFFFKYPETFDGLIALSGLYQVSGFVGNDGGMDAYHNSPLWYLRHMNDHDKLEAYRRNKIVFAVGQGRWEEECIRDTRAMQQVLHDKSVYATFDYWGHDVDHDWPWWRKMMPHQLDRLL